MQHAGAACLRASISQALPYPVMELHPSTVCTSFILNVLCPSAMVHGCDVHEKRSALSSRERSRCIETGSQAGRSTRSRMREGMRNQLQKTVHILALRRAVVMGGRSRASQSMLRDASALPKFVLQLRPRRDSLAILLQPDRCQWISGLSDM